MSLQKIATKNVICADAKTSIQDVAKKMRDQHVGDVVVISNEEGKKLPIGIITDRDIVVSAVAFGIDPETVCVQDLMTPSPICAKLNDSLWHALTLMKEHGVKRLPLLNDSGDLDGIISSDDVIGLLGAELTHMSKIQIKQRSIELNRRKLTHSAEVHAH